MNIARNIEQGRNLFPAKDALTFEGKRFSYADLDQMANKTANGLRRMGISRGDRVALLLQNSPEMVFTYLGILKLGAIAVSINPSLKAREIEFTLNDCGAKLAITFEALRLRTTEINAPDTQTWVTIEGATDFSIALSDLLDASPEARAVTMQRDDPAAIVYTSGTTGFPKGAVLSHGNVISNMRSKKRLLDIRPEDRLLLFLPLFHCFGQNAVLNSGLHAGATIALQKQFEPAQVLESIDIEQITMFFGVPTNYILLLDKASRRDLRLVRYFFSAAASLPVEVEHRWLDRFGAVIHQGYGLTETSPFASYNHHHKHKPGSIGTPIDNVEMRIVDAGTDHDVAVGELGEIMIRGPNVMLGYWNRPDESAKVLRDGWFRTGDIGHMDEEGYFFIDDRVKDMVNIGGFKVYPAEVENVIYKHPAVGEVAVYGVPDAVMGEQVMASVVLKSDHSASAETILAICRDHLADYKIPCAVAFVDSIPKNPTGKVLKRVLRQQHALSSLTVTAISPETFLQQRLQQTAAPPLQPRITTELIQQWLRNWMASHLKVEPQSIGHDASFHSFGLESLSMVRMMQELCAWLNHFAPLTIAWNYPTIDSLSHELAKRVDDRALNPLNEFDPQQLNQEATDPLREPAAALSDLSDDEVANLLKTEIDAARRRESE
jgi:long-chain acyl-CoA synthetase